MVESSLLELRRLFPSQWRIQEDYFTFWAIPTNMFEFEF